MLVWVLGDRDMAENTASPPNLAQVTISLRNLTYYVDVGATLVQQYWGYLSISISDRVLIFRVWRPWTTARHTIALWTTWWPPLMWWSTMLAGATRSRGRPFPLVSVLLRNTTRYITHFPPSSLFSVCLLTHTEANMLSHWRNFHQWMHQKLLNDGQLRRCSFERSLSTRSANLVISYRHVLFLPAPEVGKSCRL